MSQLYGEEQRCIYEEHYFSDIDCGLPLDVENATSTVNCSHYGCETIYICIVGHSFDDSTSEQSIQCLDSGQWEAVNGSCHSMWKLYLRNLTVYIHL